MLRIFIPKENEARVAATPESVKKFVAAGFEVFIEENAGLASGFINAEYEKAGAKIGKNDCDILLCVNYPANPPAFSFIVGLLSPYDNQKLFADLQQKKASAASMELVPRISRAQNMDVLSSQSNLAGYRAVIEAVNALSKATPMMMTAAGTVIPAKVFVLGAGVAGLQAIATAKRLGSVVSATDVRLAAKEQVESLGAKFVHVDNSADAEDKSGYAKETSAEYQEKQKQLLFDTLKNQDIVITTALIPGRPAPELITEDMLDNMQAGAVLLDMAVLSGGNYRGSKADELVVRHNGVKLLAPSNLPAKVARDASSLYAKNLLNFMLHLFNKEDEILQIDSQDEIIKNCILTIEGKIVNEKFGGEK
jgi:NAD(P) transhydrogenase subunit alpha